jgi:hypothetical protein
MAAAALFDPAVLYSPIAPTPLLRPGRQDPLGVEVRIALVFEGPLHHRQNFLDGLAKKDLPSDLRLDQ